MYQALVGIGLPAALILIMIGVGLSLTFNDFTRVFAQPRAFLVGITCQMLLLPVIAVLIIDLAGLSGELAIGLFILALCPGGTTSNLYSFLAKADVGLSISLTTVAGFITTFTVPLLGNWAIYHYAGANSQFELPVLITWVKLMAITIIPTLIGIGIRLQWQGFAEKAEPYVGRLSAVILILMIISIAWELGEKVMSYLLQAGFAALALNVLTMALGYLVGKWLVDNERQARTISLEVGLQNGTLALLVTVTILDSAAMSIGPSVYSLLMLVTASLFTMAVLRKDKTVQGKAVTS
ncbi:bile acid:sodium symporter family protein [Salinisphaera sp. G21_0]|uniref:bile acid:sodium symporter family protein n=1 Tax=Salinisphaera sp. G21_0 TaxID=2821094 RepID=UPI001ADC7376|nr:bile acid:sodium symporter family protein [Salinisphaera sp. G21_0]MBO9483840.1 bile acid:sodium symporter family protein [Salinisphaera sp. G21_0]